MEVLLDSEERVKRHIWGVRRSKAEKLQSGKNESCRKSVIVNVCVVLGPSSHSGFYCLCVYDMLGIERLFG